jgi:chromosome segregation ATPase
MGGKKNRRRQVSADWYASVTDESDTNAADKHNVPELSATWAVGERADSNDNGQTDTRNSTRRSREGKRASPPRLKLESTLGQWTQAVDEAINGMEVAQRTIGSLQGMFITHADDLGMVEETKKMLDQAKEEGRAKDEELRRRENTILTLTSMDQKSKAVTEAQLAQIVADRHELERERTKLESRVTVAAAEEKHRLNRDFEERFSTQDKSHEARMKELEVEFAQKRQESSKKATALESEQGRLLILTKQQQETIKAQAEELERLKNQNDILDRATTSFKSEKKDLEKELGTMKKDFAVDTKPVAYLYVLFVRLEQVANEP